MNRLAGVVWGFSCFGVWVCAARDVPTIALCLTLTAPYTFFLIRERREVRRSENNL